MTFSEVREYQYGDDIRDIDWNVTARHNHPYVKVYEEERELTVMLLVDVSGSRLFGALGVEKREMIAEIACGTCQRYGCSRRRSKRNDAHQIIKSIFRGETCGEHNINDISFDLFVEIISTILDRVQVP